MQVLIISQLRKETFPQQTTTNHSNNPDFQFIADPRFSVCSWESPQRAAHPDAPPNPKIRIHWPLAVAPRTTKMNDRDYGDDMVVDKQWVSFHSRNFFPLCRPALYFLWETTVFYSYYVFPRVRVRAFPLHPVAGFVVCPSANDVVVSAARMIATISMIVRAACVTARTLVPRSMASVCQVLDTCFPTPLSPFP